MDWRLAFRWLLAVLLAGVGGWRLLLDVSMAAVPDAPAATVVALGGQAVTALAAALCLVLVRVAPGRLALALFAVFVLVQMAADAFAYGIRSLVEALAGSLLGLALAALGWLALAPFVEEASARRRSSAGSDVHAA